MSKSRRKSTLSKPEQLDPRQIRAVEFIAAGHNVSKTAEATGVCRATIHSWSLLPAFQAAVKALILERRGFARAKLEALVEPALEALEKDLTDPTTPPILKQRAALAVLDRTGYTGKTPAVVTFESNSPTYNLELLSDAELDRLLELHEKMAPAKVSGSPE